MLQVKNCGKFKIFLKTRFLFPRQIFPLKSLYCKQDLKLIDKSKKSDQQKKKMNLILTRSKQEHTYVWWEPFATSTPMKTVPDNTKFKNELQKQLLTNIDSVNFGGLPLKGNPSNNFRSTPAESKHLPSKKVRKRKSSGYFDLSSSSSDEDSNENKKRPIIKLSTKKNTKSLLNNKKLETEEIETVNKANLQQKNNGCKKIKKGNFNNSKKRLTADLKLKNGKTQSVKNKTKNTNESLKTDFKAICLSTIECGRIFDESQIIKNSVNVIKPSLRNKGNINCSKSDDKFKHLCNVIKNEGTGLKKMPKILLKSPCRHNNHNNGAKNQKRLVTSVTRNYKVAKPHRKGISITNDVGPAKNTSTGTADGKSAIQSVSLENHVAPAENKINLSHQLFSVSKEQEFINTLDFTSDEINDAVGHVKCPLWQKQKNLPYKQSHSSNQSKEVSKNDEKKQERPKRRREKPKQFWLLQNTSVETLNNKSKQSTLSKLKRNPKVSNKNVGQASKLYSVTKASEQDTLAEENKEGNNVAEGGSVKTPKAGKRRKKANLPEKNNFYPSEVVLITHNDEKKLKNAEDNRIYSCSGLNLDIDKETESSETLVKNSCLEKKTDKTVFKQLNELSFNNNEMGCSIIQCWHINNFKCGVFKLKVESELTCKTLHRNSHLGGVLVKGILKMKIQDRELELKEGDMAFVPPLTEWQATNIGESEAVFYYWCGRFK